MQKSEGLDNQQETYPTDGEMGWLAGILEGEGSLTLDIRRKDKNRNSVRFDIVICNTDMGIMNKCVEIFEKLGISHYINERVQPPFYRNESGEYVLKEDRKNALYIHTRRLGSSSRLLEALIPYMFGDKKQKALIIKRFVDRRLTKKHNEAYDQKDWMTILEFCKAPGGHYRAMPKKVKEVERILRDYTPNAPYFKE